jgi:biotin carboxylase
VIGSKDKAGTIAVSEKYNIKGIVTCQMENPLILMAEIAEDRGYVFPSRESIEKARNKWLMKQSFLKNNVPCAKGFLLKQNENPDFLKNSQWTFPLIVKPPDSFSSRGVYKVNNIEETVRYITDAQKYSGSGDIIIEEFMSGPEVSVESVTQDGITEVIQITDKIITPYPAAVEMAHIQPSIYEPEIQEEIKTIVIKAIKAIGLDNCASHAEVKITPRGIKMVEIGARLGGDYITSHLVPLSTGINIEAAAIQIAIRNKTELTQKFTRGAVIQYLNLPAGRKILHIGEWKNILNVPCVKHAMISAKKGDIIPSITDSAKRLGFVIVQHANRQKAIDLAQKNISQLQNYINFI